MAWFRLEDSFHSHPKVLRAGNAATGLWVRCGTYSAEHLLDGFVPTEVITRFGRKAETRALIDAHLWVETDGGMLVPDFLEYNPAALVVKERRKRDAERKRRERENVDRGSDGKFIARTDGKGPFR